MKIDVNKPFINVRNLKKESNQNTERAEKICGLTKHYTGDHGYVPGFTT